MALSAQAQNLSSFSCGDVAMFSPGKVFSLQMGFDFFGNFIRVETIGGQRSGHAHAVEERAQSLDCSVNSL